MTNVRFKYVELLRLSVEQLYYQNAAYRQFQTVPSPDLVVEPTAACTRIMERLGFVFKTTPASSGSVILAQVYGANSTGNHLLKFRPKAGDQLSFYLLLRNRDVVNFSDLPTQSDNQTLYFFSNGINAIGVPRNHLHLTANATGVSGADVIRKASQVYHHHHASVLLPGMAVVRHSLTGQTVTPASLALSGGETDLTFNLLSLPAGKCRLLINNIQVEEFYHTDAQTTGPVFGVIELFLSITLNANYRILEPDNSLSSTRPQFFIRFPNRKTFWRYTVQLTTTSPLYREIVALPPADRPNFINQLNIKTNDPAITFHRQSATDTTFVFVSDTEIFLREKYAAGSLALNLSLRKLTADPATEAVVKAYLPYPSTTGINALSPPHIYSDIFLTL